MVHLRFVISHLFALCFFPILLWFTISIHILYSLSERKNKRDKPIDPEYEKEKPFEINMHSLLSQINQK